MIRSVLREVITLTDTYYSAGKYALALKCLLAAHAIDSSDPTLHVQIVRFRLALNSLEEPMPEKVSEVVLKEFETILPKATNLSDWNSSCSKLHQQSVDHVRAALSARLLITPNDKAVCEREFISTLDLPSTTLDKAIAGIETLQEWQAEQSTKQTYNENAHKRWTEASVFIK